MQDTQIENFLQHTQELQQSTITRDDFIDLYKLNLYDNFKYTVDGFYDIMSKEMRRDILVYYKLYMLYIISWLGNVFLFIQLAAILEKKDSTGVSLTAFIVFLITGISWLIYGYLIKDYAIIVSGIVRLIGLTALLIVIPKYQK